MNAVWIWVGAHYTQLGVILTAAGVLVAAVYAFLTWRLWQATRQQAQTSMELWIQAVQQTQINHHVMDATRQQAEITRRTFETVYRPYVEIAIADGSWFSHARHYLIRFTGQCHGQVPAFLTRWEIAVASEGGEPEAHNQSDDDWRRALFPGERFEATSQGPAAEPENPRPPVVTVTITVSYTGVREAPYETRAVFRQGARRQWTLLEQQLTS